MGKKKMAAASLANLRQNQTDAENPEFVFKVRLRRHHVGSFKDMTPEQRGKLIAWALDQRSN